MCRHSASKLGQPNPLLTKADLLSVYFSNFTEVTTLFTSSPNGAASHQDKTPHDFFQTLVTRAEGKSRSLAMRENRHKRITWYASVTKYAHQEVAIGPFLATPTILRTHSMWPSLVAWCRHVRPLTLSNARTCKTKRSNYNERRVQEDLTYIQGKEDNRCKHKCSIISN